MRLIDADAFLENMKRTNRYFDVKFDIDEMPTIDAVPVVRCRECKLWKKGNFQAGDDVAHMVYGGSCLYSSVARFENDFCSYGERKEGADNEP